MSYSERFHNLFTAYAPEKCPLIPKLLQKYEGREEEVLQSLIKRFGPEPSMILENTPHEKNSSSNSNNNGENKNNDTKSYYRERLIRFYNKYAPKKLSRVDKTLTRFSEREEELFFALVKMYGPEPEEPYNNNNDNNTSSSANVVVIGGVKGTDNFSDTQSNLSTSTVSSVYVPYNVNDIKWRFYRLLMQYAPEKLTIVDQLLEKYAGHEESILSTFVDRYGSEPPSPSTQTPQIRLFRFMEHYVPHKTALVDSLLAKYVGKEEILFGTLVNKLGPEPPALLLTGDGPPILTFRQRLTRFYKVYARDKLANVDVVLRRYKGKEEEMFRLLVAKYGPEPDLNIDPDAPLPAEKNYHARLIRLFTVYAPQRVESVPLLLKRYKGREEEIVEALVKKLGPEPPLEDAADATLIISEEKKKEEEENNEKEYADSKEVSKERRKVEKWNDWLRHLLVPSSMYRRYAVNYLGEERVTLLESRFGIPRLIHTDNNNSDDNNNNNNNNNNNGRWVLEQSNSDNNKNLNKSNGDAEDVESKIKDSNTSEMVEVYDEPIIAENISANFACFILMLETVEFPLPERYEEGDIFRRYPFCTVLSERDEFTLQTCNTFVDLQKDCEEYTRRLWREEEVTRQRLLQHIETWKIQHDSNLDERNSYMKRVLVKAIELLPEFEEKERQEIETVEKIEFKAKNMWFLKGIETNQEDDISPFNEKYDQKLHRWKSLVSGNNLVVTPLSTRCIKNGNSNNNNNNNKRRGISSDPYLRRSLHKVEERIKFFSPQDENQEEKEEEFKKNKFHNLSHDKHRILIAAAPPHTTSINTTSINRRNDVKQTSSYQSRTPSRSIFFSNLSPSPITPQTVGESTERILQFSEILKEKSTPTLSTTKINPTGRDKWGPARDGRLSELTPPPSAKSFQEAVLLDEVIPASIITTTVKGKQYLGESEILQNYCYTPFFFEGEGASSSSTTI